MCGQTRGARLRATIYSLGGPVPLPANPLIYVAPDTAAEPRARIAGLVLGVDLEQRDQQLGGRDDVVDVHPLVDGVDGAHAAAQVGHLEPAAGEDVGVAEIGRASCRERGENEGDGGV